MKKQEEEVQETVQTTNTDNTATNTDVAATVANTDATDSNSNAAAEPAAASATATSPTNVAANTQVTTLPTFRKSFSEQQEEAEAYTGDTRSRYQIWRDAKNKATQQRAEAAQARYNELRDMVGNPTEEQVLATMGDDLYSWQKYYNNGMGNFGLALGSNAMWGKMNPRTMQLLSQNYDNLKKEEETKKQNEASTNKNVIGIVKKSDGTDLTINQGLKDDLTQWAKSVYNLNYLSESEIEAFNAIMARHGMPTTVITDEDGNRIIKEGGGASNSTATETELNPDGTVKSIAHKEKSGGESFTMPTAGSLKEFIIESPEAEALDDMLEEIGFYDKDGNLQVPHDTTFEELQKQRQAYKDQLDLKVQQKDIERAKNRLGLADLAAVIGDMTKAAGGGVVTKRDYENKYKALTEQQQKNFANYQARMQKLKDEARADQKEKEVREQKQRDAIQSMRWARENEAAKQKWEEEKFDKTITAKAQEAARENWKTAYEMSIKETFYVPYGDKNYKFTKTQWNNTTEALMGILRPKMGNDYQGILTDIEKSAFTDFQQVAINNAVNRALHDKAILSKLTTEQLDEITKLLKNTSIEITDISTRRGSNTGTKTDSNAGTKTDSQDLFDAITTAREELKRVK